MSTLTLKELSAPAGEVIKIAAGKTLDLKSQGSVTMPTGSVLQVLIVEDNTGMVLTTSTFTNTNMTASITPSSTSSKILAMWNVQARHNGANTGFGTQLLRDSTAIFNVPLYSNYSADSGDRRWASYNHMDSPNTTSAVTYTVQVGSHSGGNMEFNENGTKTQLTLMEIQG